MPGALRDALRRIPLLRRIYRLGRYRAQLLRESWRDRAWRRKYPQEPLPPAKLRHRVHGALDRESFLATGRTLSADIRKLAKLGGKDLFGAGRVLDFGSGSARVLANFGDAPASCEFFGTDIDSELVEWCTAHLPRVHWARNAPLPPLAYPDSFFDIIYSVSVFTHLDETYQHAWLRELQRVAKPGALLILTVHGESVIRSLPPAQASDAVRDGFLFVTGDTGVFKLDGLPDFYQDAYHTKAYIEREWSQYFTLLSYEERAINGHQDAVLLNAR